MTIFMAKVSSLFLLLFISYTNFKGAYTIFAAVLLSPYADATLYRNPRNKNAGNLVSLSEFLALANNATSVSGVLIRIEVTFLSLMFIVS